MQLLFENNATTTIAGSISPTSTTINLATGSGALFPNPVSGSQYFTATLQSVTIPSQIEIIWVTARAGDVCTVVRNQENTVAAAFAAGDTFAGLITAGWFTVMQQTSLVSPMGMAVYSTPGTYSWAPPANVSTVFYEVWGAGGGGGGCSGTSFGTGGGGGGYTAGVLTGLTPSTPVTVVVGAGGSGGASGGGNGTPGLTSSFGSASATAGGGGAGNSAAFGLPGVGTGGLINFSGVTGGYGQFTPTGVILGGIGGSAFKSPSPTPGVNNTAGGSPFPGAGGNGAGSNTATGYAGGPGSNGMVIITWS